MTEELRHFIMDVWLWTTDRHSRPLKDIRFESDHFPTELECNRIMLADDEVKEHIKSGIGIRYVNLREYKL